MPDYLKILHNIWGYDGFRGIQQDIIESIGSGKDTLGLMPTGGGKSITFQVPALAQEGICIVVTPLIALMKDQVKHLQDKGIKALCIHSGMSHDQILTTLENCIFGDYKFLYVSPERLQSELFLSKLHRMNVSFITVDEAHCISQWGYDFRPSYMEIAKLRKEIPWCPILALTATATPRVVNDIQNQLCFTSHNVFRMSFERKNLSYIVRKTENKPQELLDILKSTEGSAIIYIRNREHSRETADWLNQNNISTLYYHAGLANTDKDIRQNTWQEGKVRVMVSTNAFGMGIDKPDVRTVIHMDLPDSIESYFQEAGRAGRDGKPAQAILLYNKTDRTKLLRRIEESYPSKEYIRNLYEDISCYYQMAVGDGYGVTKEFNETDFCMKFHYFPVQVESALKLLTRAGYLEYRDEDDNNSRIMFMLQREDLYKLHSMAPHCDTLIGAILRTYGGVFSQYVAIEERLLANLVGTTPESVYLTLKSLNQQRILHYIPRKYIPHITYTLRRLEASELIFSPEIYDNRKEEFRQRIDAILKYAEEDTCRSQQLLAYFGEKDTEKCGQCDVCQNAIHGQSLTTEEEHAATAIVELLSDGKSHPLEDIRSLPFPISVLANALQYLTEEEEITFHAGQLTLS